MRLSRIERDVIVREARESFGPDARVKLFGSRTDDSRRGGDIDLLVQSDVCQLRSSPALVQH